MISIIIMDLCLCGKVISPHKNPLARETTIIVKLIVVGKWVVFEDLSTAKEEQFTLLIV